ncbi:MAG: hypothetical protein MUC59_01175 [Saprospiraceae bacterium]|jgi:hypothetical protein|nr:hypothetical protein [Saprospiraceae bacterium]
MANEEIIGPNIRVADILEQIERLDKMIAFHKMHAPDDAMLKQYQYLRRRYSLELTRLMKMYNFHLSPIKQKVAKPKSKQIKAAIPLS